MFVECIQENRCRLKMHLFYNFSLSVDIPFQWNRSKWETDIAYMYMMTGNSSMFIVKASNGKRLFEREATQRGDYANVTCKQLTLSSIYVLQQTNKSSCIVLTTIKEYGLSRPLDGECLLTRQS